MPARSHSITKRPGKSRMPTEVHAPPAPRDRWTRPTSKRGEIKALRMTAGGEQHQGTDRGLVGADVHHRFIQPLADCESAGAFTSTATGIRTRVSAVRGRRPSPLDDSGV